MATRCIPAHELFCNPVIAQVQIAPDGTHLAWLAPRHGHLNIWLYNPATDSGRFLTDERQRSIQTFIWANSHTIAYLHDTNGDENYRLFLLDIRTADPPRLCTPPEGVRTTIISSVTLRDDIIVIAHNGRQRELFDPYALHLSDGSLEPLAENPGGITDWLVDYNGVVRAAVRTDGANTTLLYRENSHEQFREILTTNFRTILQPLRFTADGQHLYVLSNRGRDTAAVYVFDPATAREERLIAANDTFDMSGAIYSFKYQDIVACRYVSWKPETIVLHPTWQALLEYATKKLTSALGEPLVVALSDCSLDEERFVIVAFSDRHPSSYYFLETTTGQMTKLGDAMPHLSPDELAPMQPIQYRSRDGMLIRGYLTLPREHTKPVPVVVLPHGGPWTRDTWGFNPAVQLFANRGYGVLQVNYRGSTGYGRAFWEASFKQWGRTMQDDLSDGIRWLIANGIADPERIAIVGGSYGGYAVLAGLAFTPELYRCGVDIVGVSNLLTFRKTIPPYWKPLNDMLNEMIGNPETEEEFLREVSPVYHADRIQAPLLVFQGANDPRVNKAESDQIVEALRSRGIPVEYYVRDDEGHGFLDERNRVEMYTIIERFLAEHLGGRCCNGRLSAA